MTITPEQITSAWALVNAASEGPWREACDENDSVFDVDSLPVAFFVSKPNAAFIAASRELVPQLLTSLEAERAKVARQ